MTWVLSVLKFTHAVNISTSDEGKVKMTMTHEELVAKRNAIKAKGNWDSTKPMPGPKYVVNARAKEMQKPLKDSK